MNVFFLFLCLFGCDYCTEHLPNIKDYKKTSAGFVPQKVVLVIRHGDRTPERSMGKGVIRREWHDCVFTEDKKNKRRRDQYVEEVQSLKEKTRCKAGALTQSGCDRLYKLGMRLKEIYTSHYGLVKRKKNVKARTTSVERTKASAICLLKGMFERKTFKLHHHEHKKDTLLGVRDVTTEEIRDKETRAINEVFFDRMKRDFPEYKEPFPIRDYHMASKCNRRNGGVVSIEKENGDEKRIAKTVNDYSLEIEAALSKNKEYVKRTAGPLLKEICFEIENHTSRMFIFSAHDTTIHLLFNGLKVRYNRWPGYNTNMIFEKGLLSGKSVIRIILNGVVYFFDWINADANGFIPYDEFKEHIKQIAE